MSHPCLLLRFSLLLALGAMPAVTAGGDQPAAPAGDAARGAHLVARAVEAMGGAAAVDAVRTLEVRSSTSRQLEGGQKMEIEMVTYAQPPDRLRQEIKTPAGWAYSLLNPEGAFFVIVNQSMNVLPEAARARLHRELKSIPLVLLQERSRPGFRALKVGAGEAGGTPVEMVDVEAGEGQRFIVSIDPATGVIRQLKAAGTSGDDAVVWTFSDYRPVDGGIKYPFRATASRGTEEVAALHVNKVQVNGTLEARLFNQPAPANFLNPNAPGMPALGPSPAPPSASPSPSPKRN